MKPAQEFQQAGHVCIWEAYDPSVKANLTSCAILTGEAIVFVDPIPLQADALAELSDLGPPAAVVLTNGNHARSALQFRDRFEAPIYASEQARAGLGISLDKAVKDGDIIASEIKVIEVPGAGPGEIALLSTKGSLHVGDALINAEPHGFSILPAKYCEDPKTLLISLQKLLRFEFEVLTFAHGLPLVSRARDRLSQLLL